jgi:hypothetical protein
LIIPKMQKVSPLPAGHPVKQLSALSRQIALPHEYSPERFPSFPALERTAVMAFSQPTSWVVPGSAVKKVMLTRQAAWPMWADQTLNRQAYSATWGGDAAATADTTVPINGTVLAWSSGDTTPGSVQPGFSASSVMNTVYPLLGVDSRVGGMPFIFVPANFTAAVCVSTPPNGFAAISAVTLNADLWLSPGETTTITMPDVLTTAVANFGASGTIAASSDGYWLRPRSLTCKGQPFNANTTAVQVTISVFAGTAVYTPSNANCGNYAVAGANKVTFVPLIGPSEFANSTLPWSAARTTAVGVLMSNVTQVLNKGGTILAGRVSPAVQNPWNVTSSYINALHPAEKAFLPFETGFYSYCPPSTDLVNFWDYTLTQGAPGAITAPGNCPLYRLDNDSMVNVAFFTAASNDETLAVTVDWHIEFRTSSALFQIGLSTVTLETLHQAQIALTTVGFFFENFDHKAILNAVTGAVRKYGPAALYGAVKMVNPTIAHWGAQGYKLLTSKPKNTMVATSAAASGITKPAKRAPSKKKPVKSKRVRKGGKK